MRIRAGPQEGEARGALKGLRRLPQGGKLRTNYHLPDLGFKGDNAKDLPKALADLALGPSLPYISTL